MKSYPLERIRNVVLLSHCSAGKTSLAEALLFHTGAISRLGKVDDGTSTSDFDPEEVKRQISISLSLAPCEWQNTKLNLIDTPGYADFVGEVKAGIHVADAAVVVLCSASGVEVGSELVWRYADEVSLPRILFLNKIDRENADFFKTLGQARAVLRPSCVPIQLPIGSQHAFQGIIDLVKMRALTGSDLKEGPIPAELQAEADAYREKLVEAAAENDDELITKYLEGEALTEEEIVRGLQKGTKEGKVVPVLVGTALLNRAIEPLLDAIITYLPDPSEGRPVEASTPNTNGNIPLKADANGPLAALVFKSTADPYIGKLTYLRVYSGVLKSDSHVWNANKNRDERLGQLFIQRGKSQEAVASIPAGDIGAVAKLAETSTCDTLCTKEHPLRLPPISFPVPSYSAAIYPKTKADLDKLGPALARLAEEDYTIRVSREPDTGETILSGQGESHIEVAVEKMKRKFGVEVHIEQPKVPYKETITTSTKAEYKHKKQTGGHGQYGHVFLEIEPLPRASGFEFAERVVGGVVPKNYIPAVEKGVVEAIQEGILAHYPVTDIKVTLYDGSYHPVDSSEMSFKLAASHALKKGLQQANPVLLEPIMNVHIQVPDSFLGDTMSDLNSRRARVQGTMPGEGVTVIEAQVPQAEMLRYATVLRSITQGRGSFTMEFDHYDEVPAHIAQPIIAEAKKTE